jgi:hypothetical protein
MERAVSTAMAGLDAAGPAGGDGYEPQDAYDEEHDEQHDDQQDGPHDSGAYADADAFGDDPDEELSHG